MAKSKSKKKSRNSRKKQNNTKKLSVKNMSIPASHPQGGSTTGSEVVTGGSIDALLDSTMSPIDMAMQREVKHKDYFYSTKRESDGTIAVYIRKDGETKARRVTLNPNKSSPVIFDGHVHVYTPNDLLEGGDGAMTLQDSVHLANENGVTHMVAVMHNSLTGFVEYVHQNNLDPTAVSHNIDGVNVYFGAEVTVRDTENPNEKGYPTKAHLLVISPKLTPDSPIVRLLAIKSRNDEMVDYGLIQYIAKVNGINLNPETIKEYVLEKRKTDSGYNTIGRRDVLDFFAKNKIDLAMSNRDLDRLMEQAPRMSRLNISMQDLIKVAHASGALVIFAHPGVNLRRAPTPESTIKNFLKHGGDGFEAFYNGMSRYFHEMILDIVKESHLPNKMVYTQGSDTHSLDERNTIGKISKGKFAPNSQLDTVEVLGKIGTARAKGALTDRVYEPYTDEEIEDIINKYAIEMSELERVYMEKASKVEDFKAIADEILQILSPGLGDPVEESSALRVDVESVDYDALKEAFLIGVEDDTPDEGMDDDNIPE